MQPEEVNGGVRGGHGEEWVEEQQRRRMPRWAEEEGSRARRAEAYLQPRSEGGQLKAMREERGEGRREWVKEGRR